MIGASTPLLPPQSRGPAVSAFTVDDEASATSGPPIVIVSVHGIGDQVRNATALSTIVRFCDYLAYPGVIPLGALHRTSALPLKAITGCHDACSRLRFAEVHWAHIARKVVDEGYTLQETTAWTRTLVNRVRVLAAEAHPECADTIDYQRIRLVLEEMIQTIRVLDSLLVVAKKAGLFSFELKQTLDQFLGDVQLVTEFESIREEVLANFDETLSRIHQENAGAEIHLVAHSEGTVVSFLALLEALHHPTKHPWIAQVKGFLTLGSPIDKHLILWPELFQRYARPPVATLTRPIRWINFSDLGDPVGFSLDTARDWMAHHGYVPKGAKAGSTAAFDFRKEDDLSFRRYPIPGKAHVDYWKDDDVFAYYITRAVLAPKAELSPKPPNRNWTLLISHGVAYALPLILMIAGVYLLFKGVAEAIGPAAPVVAPSSETPPSPESTPDVATGMLPNVVLFGLLAYGTTAAIRILQLFRSRAGYGWAAAVYVLTLAIYLGGSAIWSPSAHVEWLLVAFDWLPETVSERAALAGLSFVAVFGALLLNEHLDDRLLRRNLERPRGAMPRKPEAHHLLRWFASGLGAALLLTIVIHLIQGQRNAVWPVVLGAAAFLYLWWLGALLFGLMTVWHRYIRHAAVSEFLRHDVARPDCQPAAAGASPAS